MNRCVNEDVKFLDEVTPSNTTNVTAAIQSWLTLKSAIIHGQESHFRSEYALSYSKNIRK
jgi:hypothetical protein